MAIFADRQNQIWRLTAILELPPSWNVGAVARNPGVSWAFLFLNWLLFALLSYLVMCFIGNQSVGYVSVLT